MRAYVLGVGRMGKAIAYGMNKLGFSIAGMDTNIKAATNLPCGVDAQLHSLL